MATPDPNVEQQPDALTVSGMTKRFTGVPALDEVGLQVAGGSVCALLGGNGSGKSTLIKALAGIQPADEGQITVGDRSHQATEMTPRIARDCGMRFVHQQLPVFPDLTVAENLAIEHGWESDGTGRIKWKEQNKRAASLLERFGVSARPKDPLGYYSVATQAMVTVARAMQDLDEAGILVLDEPTSAFPPAQVRLLLDFVRAFAQRGHSVIYVTHRLDEVMQVADHATILRDGKLDCHLRRTELSHERLAQAIIGPAAASSSGQWTKRRSDNPPLVEVTGLAGGPVLDASFKLRPGEIVGLAGLLGSGRSTLLKTIFGAVKSDSGSVRMAGKEVDREEPRKAMFAGIAYVPENRLLDAAFTTMSVTENLGMATTGSFFQRGRLDHRSERRAAHTLIKDYRVKAPSAKANLATLSGGNQQKVILARWLRRNPRLILLDEPTQGVDIGARQEIWQLIRSAVDAGACALVATSDLDELATFCDRALVMQGGQITAEVEPEEMTEHHLEQLAFSLQEEDGQ